MVASSSSACACVSSACAAASALSSCRLDVGLRISIQDPYTSGLEFGARDVGSTVGVQGGGGGRRGYEPFARNIGLSRGV